MEQLKPCPFCGGKVDIHETDGIWYVNCIDCPAMLDENYLAEAKAIDAWNKRATDGLVPKLVEALDIIANGNVDKIVAGKRMRAHTVGFHGLRKIAHKALALYKTSGLAPEGQKGQEKRPQPL